MSRMFLATALLAAAFAAPSAAVDREFDVDHQANLYASADNEALAMSRLRLRAFDACKYEGVPMTADHQRRRTDCARGLIRQVLAQARFDHGRKAGRKHRGDI